MLKKLLSLMVICAIIFSANCSRIEHNEDPIIGKWFETESVTNENSSKTTLRKEWIFNDVYLGRYNEINGNELTLKTDFNWSKSGDIYTIEYRGLEGKSNHIITIENTADGTLLLKTDGNPLAIRE